LSEMDLRCPQCGAPLVVGERHCGNCGAVVQEADEANPATRESALAQTPMSTPPLAPTVLPEHDRQSTLTPTPTPSASNAAAPADYSSGADYPDSAANPYAQPASQAGYGPTTYSQIPAIPAQASYPSNPAYPPQEQAGPNPAYPYPGQAGYAPNAAYPPYQGQQPGPYPPYAPNAPYPPNGPYPPYPAQKPKKGRGLLIGLLVGLVVIVVLCAGSVTMLAGTISKLSDMGPSSNDTNSNGGTVATSTASNGSVPAPSGAALFKDDFVDNSNGWEFYSDKKDSVALQKGGLKLHDSDGTYMLAPVPQSDGLSDFRLDLTYTPSLGGSDDQAGIIFRGQDTPSDAGPEGYLLKIDNQGNYVIRKITVPVSSNNPKGTYSDLDSGVMDTAPLAGKPIDVTLLMKKNTIVLYLNGSYQGSVSDPASSFKQGTISLFVENVTDGTAADALFQHIAVYPAPATLPTN
jgi:Domain of Unknown Function (DUF1080).